MNRIRQSAANRIRSIMLSIDVYDGRVDLGELAETAPLPDAVAVDHHFAWLTGVEPSLSADQQTALELLRHRRRWVGRR